MSEVALSEPAYFLCKKNKNFFSDGEYPLMIDIDKKKMIRAYTEYEMQVSKGYLTGINEVNKPYRTIIVLNRYNLELHVNFYNDNSLNLDNSYKTTCRKVVKQI
ncbi:hypothetical protein N9N62_00285 [Candidatus Pelagibacter bacterium]|nr:hypothetical protein [Candidatus Pelagibacter bacterium]MDA8800727.1 hypothetical protein [Candidatus Pelagibacter bacterium]